MIKTYYISAGGNKTALIREVGYDRDCYATINHQIQRDDPRVEQVGFYETHKGYPKLQMAGGEFCGNASMMFACLLGDMHPNENEFSYFASGFDGLIQAQIARGDDASYRCTAYFSNYKYILKHETFNGSAVTVANLGGIIHIIVNSSDIPFNTSEYVPKLKQIKDALKVDHDAVGVLWVSDDGDQVTMQPVVWVRAIDTCYYESSCGSGSIAVALARGKTTDVQQPSGQFINVRLQENTLILSSEIKRI